MQELTLEQLQLAMQYLEDLSMELPEELKDVSDLQLISVEVLLESLKQEKKQATLH